MSDFLAALGLVFVIEGMLFAGFPDFAKRAMASAMQTPEAVLRFVGVASAIVGLLLIWFVRS